MKRPFGSAQGDEPSSSVSSKDMDVPCESSPTMIDLSNRQALTKAVHDLYEVFGGYRKVELSPTQPSEAADLPNLQAIRRHPVEKPFDALTAKDLLDYFYLAVDHIGDADDLRHFLPKLLETMIERDGTLLAPAHLPSLLNSAGAGEWPLHERNAIAAFALAAADAGVISDRIAAQILKSIQ